MTDHELDQLRRVTDTAVQAKVICTLVENYPHKFENDEITAIASLLKTLTNSVSIYLNQEVSKSDPAH